MRNETRLAFNALALQIATINGVGNAMEKFTVAPSVQQTLETRIQEGSEFLSKINIIGVTEQKGEKLGLGVGSPIASTTNTNTTDRTTKDVTEVDGYGYECAKTDFDTHIKYSKLDAWAKFKDFQSRVRDNILKRQALDRITIGFNGTSRAATSNLATNPLLQDVNKGWLQQYRDLAAARVMKEVVVASNEIKIGAAGDYQTLDALVFDAVNALIDPWHQERTDLVAIVGRDMLHDKYFPLVNVERDPSEQAAVDMIISQKRIGGLQALRVPNFPAGKVFITSLDNLSIYWQEGGRRRTIVDNAKRDQIENYESSNDAYVIEDFGAGCLLENIVIL